MLFLEKLIHIINLLFYSLKHKKIEKYILMNQINLIQ